MDEAERALKGFKPVTYDVQAHIKAIEAFEAKAVSVSILTLSRFCPASLSIVFTLSPSFSSYLFSSHPSPTVPSFPSTVSLS